MRVNAMTEKFEDVTVLGHPMLFTCARVDRDTVPKGLYIMLRLKREIEDGKSQKSFLLSSVTTMTL